MTRFIMYTNLNKDPDGFKQYTVAFKMLFANEPIFISNDHQVIFIFTNKTISLLELQDLFVTSKVTSAEVFQGLLTETDPNLFTGTLPTKIFDSEEKWEEFRSLLFKIREEHRNSLKGAVNNINQELQEN